MDSRFAPLGFGPADILLPRDCDLNHWCVVACDQYSSQPEYWQRVAGYVGQAPSALHLVLPESRLPAAPEEIDAIHRAMDAELAAGRFAELPDSLIYVERTLSDGKVRRGLIGQVDLECYGYTPGSGALIRATEGTVLSRIPPRVAVRQGASLELPHVLLLLDDPERAVIEPLGAQTGQMEPLYDFELMEGGGHIAGWRLNEAQVAAVARGLAHLADPEVFAQKYDAEGRPVLLFAVGDGNHSLASAKAAYEAQRGTPAAALTRYALVELGNLHDESLEFEAIHRVCFGVDPEDLLRALLAAYPGAHLGSGEGQQLHWLYAGGEGIVTVPDAPYQLPLATLQAVLDPYLAAHGGHVDYIHGEDVARRLGAQPGNLAFLLPALGKDELFKTVIFDGVLPRKTFSMGRAQDKRFYLEARRIR